jgi:hypothetical protein
MGCRAPNMSGEALAERGEGVGERASQYSKLSFVDWLMAATNGPQKNSVHRQMFQIGPVQ